MIGHIYKITSPSNKIYIGQSWSVEKRINNYKKLTGSISKHLKNAFKLYGVKNFNFEIIDFATTQELLNIKEEYWITYYNSIDNGYNLKHGGSNGKHTEETKIKCSIANKGKRFSKKTEFQKGHKWTDEIKKKLSIGISLGKKNKPLTENHKIALRKPKNVSEEQKKLNSLRYKGMTWKIVNGKRVWINK